MTTTSTRRVGFYVDMDSCTGCKACQLACKNKNNLASGLLWRKVVEVQGGDWIKQGDAWKDNTYVHFLSLSCMHCDRPICVEVCPTKASHKREDGIVSIDAELCIGCSYCEMACPYGALKFNEDSRVMTKCDLCKDNVDQGKLPECVSACQMRVLEFGDLDEMMEQHGDLVEVFPLPDKALTRPSVVLKLKKKPVSDDVCDLVIGNREEL